RMAHVLLDEREVDLAGLTARGAAPRQELGGSRRVQVEDAEGEEVPMPAAQLAVRGEAVLERRDVGEENAVDERSNLRQDRAKVADRLARHDLRCPAGGKAGHAGKPP